MLHDGYGDEVTADELVANYWKWAHKVAGGIVPFDSLTYDDLVQEALIDVWKTAERKPEGVPASYLTKSMRFRMVSVVRGKPMTGGDSTPGPKSRPKETAVDWQDVTASDGEDYGLQHLLEATDVLSAVDWAYHHGEILQHLNALPPEDRAYVHQRFWEGKTDTEIAAERGVSNKYLHTRWNRTVKPKLAASLAHLATL